MVNITQIPIIPWKYNEDVLTRTTTVEKHKALTHPFTTKLASRHEKKVQENKIRRKIKGKIEIIAANENPAEHVPGGTHHILDIREDRDCHGMEVNSV